MSRMLAWRRALLVGFALSVMVAMGTRTHRGHASPWSTGHFKGPARAALTIQVVQRPGLHSARPAAQVFASSVYGTDASRYDRGLLVRTTFRVPDTGETGVLTIDLNRNQSRSSWVGDRSNQLVASYYVFDPDTDVTSFDGSALEGELSLDKIIISADAAGFRFSGWLELVDPGADGLARTADDVAIEIELSVETVPPPEEMGTGGPSPLPVVDLCEAPECYEDPYYQDDDLHYDASCDGGGGYGHDDQGCEGDTYDDGYDYAYEGGGGSYDSGCDSSDSRGCEGDSYDSGGGGAGCESDSVDSGCGSSGGGSGCGGGGCSGDTIGAWSGKQRPTQTAEIGWLPMLLLCGLVLGISRRS